MLPSIEEAANLKVYAIIFHRIINLFIIVHIF